MAIKYKRKCSRCKNKYVIVTSRSGYTVCYDCQKAEMQGEIEDPKMKELFDIPEEYYKENNFLRNIKIGYLKWRNLSEKQIEAFKKTVDKIKSAHEESKEEFKYSPDEKEY